MFSRRKFLLMAGGMCAWPMLSQAGNSTAGNGVVIGFGKAADNSCFIGTVDFDAPGHPVRWQSDIDFLGHGLMPNPVRPHIAVIAEKHGKGCVEWDMAARKVTRAITTAAERQFYGHGAFTPDGKTLFLVETVVGDASLRGVITVRDGTNYVTQGEFPSYGLAPHDAILVDGGRTLVVTNGGGTLDSPDLPCVCFIDVQTRELKRKLVFSTPRINAGHLAITARGELIVVSAPRSGVPANVPEFCGGISFAEPGKALHTAENAIVSSMRGETLSVAIHAPTMVVAATNPTGHLLTFWDFHSGRLLKAVDEFKDPRGVSLTLNGRYFVLTFDRQTHAILIDAQTLEPVRESLVERSYISGSHNYVYPAIA